MWTSCAKTLQMACMFISRHSSKPRTTKNEASENGLGVAVIFKLAQLHLLIWITLAAFWKERSCSLQSSSCRLHDCSFPPNPFAISKLGRRDMLNPPRRRVGSWISTQHSYCPAPPVLWFLTRHILSTLECVLWITTLLVIGQSFIAWFDKAARDNYRLRIRRPVISAHLCTVCTCPILNYHKHMY